MDVGDWLQGLGLGQYLALFREHAIDADVLPDLTDADLEKFGVPFGHRKRLIKAIAKLGAVPAEQAETAPPAPAALLPDASPRSWATGARVAAGASGPAPSLPSSGARRSATSYGAGGGR
jgi:hypothetical protein